MKKEFTRAEMLEKRGCYDEQQVLNLLGGKTEITLREILECNIPLKDKFWFVIKKTELDRKQKVSIAIKVAECVLPIYESKYPENKAPREAIEGAKLYMSGHITLNELLHRRRAAYAAAYAAAAAAYAAAYAAAAAAYTAADAADADADAYAYAYAYAASTYAAYAAYSDKLLNILKEFSL